MVSRLLEALIIIFSKNEINQLKDFVFMAESLEDGNLIQRSETPG